MISQQSLAVSFWNGALLNWLALLNRRFRPKIWPVSSQNVATCRYFLSYTHMFANAHWKFLPSGHGYLKLYNQVIPNDRWWKLWYICTIFIVILLHNKYIVRSCKIVSSYVTLNCCQQFIILIFGPKSNLNFPQKSIFDTIWTSHNYHKLSSKFGVVDQPFVISRLKL